MKRLWLLLTIAGLLTGTVYGQAPAWQPAIGVGNPVNSSALSHVNTTVADGDGNVYIAGLFLGTVTFGTITLTGGVTGDCFVAKWNTARGFVWAVGVGGIFTDEITSIAVSDSSVYVAGTFENATIRFGSTALVSAGTHDIFVAKLTDRGTTATWAWAQRAGGGSEDKPTALAVDGSSVYVAGNCRSNPADFGAHTFTNIGTFVARLTDGGSTSSWTWVKQAAYQQGGGSEVSAMAVQGSEVYLTGNYWGMATFGATTLTAAGGRDVFVARLTDGGTTGTWTWVQQGGSSSSDSGTALAVEGNSLYVAGYFDTYSSGGSIRFGSAALTSAGAKDVFVAKLADAGATGSWRWAQRGGGPYDDEPAAVAVRGNRVFVAGTLASRQAGFGSTTLTNTNTSGGFSTDAFLAKLVDGDSSAAWTWAQQAGGTGNDRGTTLAASGDSLYVAGNFGGTAATIGNTMLTNATGGANRMGFLAPLTDPLLADPDALEKPAFMLVPNPATHAVRIRGAVAGPISLADAMGRVLLVVSSGEGRVASSEGREASVEVDLRGVPEGVYVVRCGGWAKKLVVE